MNTTGDLLFRGEHSALPQPINSPEDGSDDPPIIVLLRDNYWHFVGYALASILGIIALVILVKCYVKKRYGLDCCVGAQHSRTQQDIAMALRLQRELDEEARREALALRREARREHMAKLLSGATLVVREEDLEHEHCDVEAGIDHSDDAEPILCVPISSDGPDGSSADDVIRRVPGRCAVCIGEYSAGDTVIWSPNRNCCHVFHDDCILSWLSRGKKRCPCCRHSFVEQESWHKKAEGSCDEPASPTEALEEENNASDAFVSEDSQSPEEEEEEEDALVLAEIIERRTVQGAADSAVDISTSVTGSNSVSSGSVDTNVAAECTPGRENIPPDRGGGDDCDDCAPQHPIERGSS